MPYSPGNLGSVAGQDDLWVSVLILAYVQDPFGVGSYVRLGRSIDDYRPGLAAHMALIRY